MMKIMEILLSRDTNLTLALENSYIRLRVEDRWDCVGVTLSKEQATDLILELARLVGKLTAMEKE